MDTAITSSTPQFLQGGGEMGELIRSTNWAATPLGDPSTWPPSLKMATSIMLSTPFPMYIAWGPGYTQLYNDGYRPILGSTKHPQAMGISTRETFAEIWHIIGDMFDGVMQGTAVGFPKLHLPLDRNGYVEDCYFDFSYSPIREENGDVGGVLVTVIEVTENVKVLRELSESRESFKKMLLQAPAAMCLLISPDFRVEIANQKMLELWGKTADEVMGKPVFEGIPDARDQGLEPLLQHVYTTGETFSAEELPIELFRNGQTETVYINFTYQAVRDGLGTIYGIAAVAIDVTTQVAARKAAEAREMEFIELTNLMPQIVFVARTDGTLEYCNRQWYEFTGSTPGAEDQMLIDTIHPDDRKMMQAAWAESLATGKVFEMELRMLRAADKTYRWFLGRSTPITDDEGKVQKWFGTSTDINEQKKNQEQKDEFISVVSHELKTPITSIKASIQILEKLVRTDPASTKVGLFMDKASSSIKKMQYLVDDLMNVSKIDAGQLKLNKVSFNLAQLVEDCTSHFELMGKHEIEIKGDTNLTVTADYQRIEQVMVNLISNAIKYAPNSRRILVSYQRQDAQIKVSVRDFGIGISAEKLPHLFNRYYRVDSSGVQYSGLGLGLYICADIIRRHGCEIEVDSIPGQGSTFYFTLPA